MLHEQQNIFQITIMTAICVSTHKYLYNYNVAILTRLEHFAVRSKKGIPQKSNKTLTNHLDVKQFLISLQ